MPSKNMDQINQEWMNYVLANPHMCRWVNSKREKDFPPLRQMKWKNKKGRNKRKFEAKLAWETEKKRWILYILDMSNGSAEISAKPVVVCNQGRSNSFAAIRYCSC